MSKPAMSHNEAMASLARRILRHTEKSPDGCLLWTGYCNPVTGYGQVSLPKALHPEFGSRICTVPVAVCWLTYGPRPAEGEVLHACDVRACLAVAHLRWGTRLENVRDAWEKGRAVAPDTHLWGEQHPQAKVTDEQVRRIVAAARAGVPVQRLADQHGMDFSQIYRWLRGEVRTTAFREGV